MDAYHNSPKAKNPATRSFLLRAWRSESDNDAAWRVFLVDPVSGDQKVFTDFGALTEFFQELLGETPSPAGPFSDPTE